MMKKYFRLMGLLLVVVMIMGCGLNNPEISRFFEISEAGDGGLVLEDYLPADETALFFALRIDSAPDVKSLNAVLALPEVMQNYEQSFEQYGLNFEEDIKDMWEVGHGRLAYAAVKVGAVDSSVSAGDLQDDVYLSLNITNHEKYDDVIKKLSGQPGYKITTYKETEILQNEDQEFYAARVGDLFIICNKIDNLRGMINEPKGLDSGSLREKREYLGLIEKINEDYWAWLYMNTELISADEIVPEAKDVVNPSGLAEYLFLGDSEDVSYRGFYLAKRDNNSVYFRGMALGFDGLAVSDSDKTIYLDKKIPGENMMMYFEKAGLAGLIEKGKNKKGYSTMVRYFSAFGFDYDRDIKPMLEKNVAVGVYNSGNLLPYVVLMVDVNGAKDQADKLIMLLEKNLSGYADSLNRAGAAVASGDEVVNDLVTKERVKTIGGTLEKFSISVHKLLPLLTKDDLAYGDIVFIPEEVSLYYGIVDNHLIIALYPDFNEVYGAASVQISNSGGTKMMLDLESLYKNVDLFALFLSKTENPGIDERISGYAGEFRQMIPVKKIYLLGKDEFGSLNTEGVVEFW